MKAIDSQVKLGIVMYDKMDEKALGCSLGGGSCYEDMNFYVKT